MRKPRLTPEVISALEELLAYSVFSSPTDTEKPGADYIRGLVANYHSPAAAAARAKVLDRAIKHRKQHQEGA